MKREKERLRDMNCFARTTVKGVTTGAFGMRTPLHYFVLLFSVIFLPALTGCGGAVQSKGSVVLLDDSDVPHSFAGATATLYALISAVVTPGQTPTPIGTGTVEEDGTTVTVKARRSAIRDARLYLVEIRCPANVMDDACVVNTPLHAVLTGAQFRAGDWQATVLTETAYQNAPYAVAVNYAVTQIRQALDNAAAALLSAPAPDTAADYADLQAWNPADTTAVKRPAQLADFIAALVAGSDHNSVQLQAQQLTGLLVGALALDNYVQDVALAGTRAYLVGSTYDVPGSLHVVDVSDPSQPQLAATLGDLGKADALQLAGDHAYVVDGGNYWNDYTASLRIISLANPDQPVPVASFTTAGRATDVAVAGGYAFISLRGVYTGNPGFAGLQIVDISNPQAPANVGSLAIASGLAHLAVSGNRVYATGDGGFYVIDINNPAAPTLAGSLAFDNALNAIAVAGQYAYTEGAGVLRIIDIENPYLPVVGSLSGTGGNDINLVGNRLYIGSDVIDISTPFAPQRIGRLAAGGYRQYVAPNGLAYTAAGSSLNIYDTSSVDRAPLLAGSAEVNLEMLVGLPGNTVAENGFAFAPNVTAGIAVFDLVDPLAPQYVGTDIFSDYISELALDSPYAYGGDVESGSLRIIDISNPAALEFEFPVLGFIQFSDSERFNPNSIEVVGQYAYVAYSEALEDPETGETIRTGGMYVVDIQTPSDPQIVAHYSASTFAQALAVSGDYAYLMLSDGGLDVIDISDPQAPSLVSSTLLPGPINFLTVAADVLYASAGSLGLHIVSVANPAAPTLLATLDTPGNARRLEVADDVVYLSDGSYGVQVVAVGNPAAPVLIGAANTIGSADGVFLYDAYLYANTSYGFEILRKMPAPAPAP